MCRPPDLLPGSEGVEFELDEAEEWDQDAALEAAAAQVQSAASHAALLGKRDHLDEAHLAEQLSRSAKRAAPASLSAFNSAASSFMAKMEQSMLEDLQRQQQQRRLAAAAAAAASEANDSSLLLQRALLEQQAKVQQLQQLHMLSQLQTNTRQKLALLPEQQQLLLAQQRLLQQRAPQAPAAAPGTQVNAPAFGALAMKQEPQWAPAAPAPGLASLFVQPSQTAALLGLGGSAMTPFHAAAAVQEDNKKCKRMQSNRASAKRSRQRRQARLEELDKSTVQLQDENSTMCQKLEQAHQQIHQLQEKNQSLMGEVSVLRKMLDMNASSSSGGKSASDGDRVSPQQSCVVSHSIAEVSAASAPVAKPELQECVLDDEEEGVDQMNSFLDLDNPCANLDQFLPQGDVLSELLACFEN